MFRILGILIGVVLSQSSQATEILYPEHLLSHSFNSFIQQSTKSGNSLEKQRQLVIRRQQAADKFASQDPLMRTEGKVLLKVMATVLNDQQSLKKLFEGLRDNGEFDEAEQMLTSWCDKNDPWALFNLAKMHLESPLSNPSLEKALMALEKGSQLEDINCLCLLAELYRAGKKVDLNQVLLPNPQKAYTLYQKAYTLPKGQEIAIPMMAKMHMEGVLHKKPDPIQAYELLKDYIQQDNRCRVMFDNLKKDKVFNELNFIGKMGDDLSQAYFKIAREYQNGFKLPKNNDRAELYFQRAIQQASWDSIIPLKVFFQLSLLKENESTHYLEKIRNSANVMASYYLAKWSLQKKEYILAKEYLQESLLITKRLPKLQQRTSKLMGQLVLEAPNLFDLEETVFYLKEAISLKTAEQHYHVACLFLFNKKIKVDLKHAAHHLKEASLKSPRYIKYLKKFQELLLNGEFDTYLSALDHKKLKEAEELKQKLFQKMNCL
jgi:TPR repeat protein